MNASLDGLVRHVRVAGRALAKMPAFTATLILTLALGIGANSAVFSAVRAARLDPIRVPREE